MKKIRHIAFGWLVFALVTTANTANADFSGAIEAFHTRDMDKMLLETKVAADKKDKNNLVLLLSLLKEFPSRWQTFSPSQRTELLKQLEIATSEASLLSQYKLALIPRDGSLDAIAEERDLLKRLEPIANKYAPAALHLYGSYAYPPRQIKADPNQAIFWLKRSAELGSAHAAFILGMKYLNVNDAVYGCDKDSPLLCLSKDEAKGRYWMERAAKGARELNLILGDFAGYMGDMLQGQYGGGSDPEEAYLWYLLAINSPWQYFSHGTVEKRLAEMKMKGELTKIAPELDKNWSNSTKRRELLHPQQLPKFPKLYGDYLEPDAPVISLQSAEWQKDIQVLDVYPDGSVHISYFEQLHFLENEETTLNIPKHEVQELMGKLRKMGFYRWQISNEIEGCLADCFDMRRYYLSVKDGSNYRSVLLSSQQPSQDPRIASILKLLSEYFPHYFPRDALRCSLSAAVKKQSCSIPK